MEGNHYQSSIKLGLNKNSNFGIFWVQLNPNAYHSLRGLEICFLTFFEAKMTKIDILNPKLIVPGDYQQFWVYFEWFLALFHISDEKWLLS